MGKAIAVSLSLVVIATVVTFFNPEIYVGVLIISLFVAAGVLAYQENQ